MNIANMLDGCQRVSRNEYHCPCPFTGQGKDRFIVWTDRGNWLCPRWQCPNCPGKPDPKTGGMKGWLDQIDNRFVPTRPQASAAEYHLPSIALVLKYAAQLDKPTLNYLRSRGIGRRSAGNFCLGTSGKRLTIPNLGTKNGHVVCWGIKKRWVGPLALGRFKYIVEPGSMGLSLFNSQELLSRQWKTVFVVEGPLDNILVTRLGVPCVSPFGGGDIWHSQWSQWITEHTDTVIHIMDRDNPGVHHAHHRATLIGDGVEHVFVHPPGKRAGDITEAWQWQRDRHNRHYADKILTKWLRQIATKEN